MNELVVFGILITLAGCGLIVWSVMDKTLTGWGRFRLLISGMIVIIGGIELLIHQ
jgi:hypothetical protein